jgi:hypothetical protein
MNLKETGCDKDRRRLNLAENYEFYPSVRYDISDDGHSDLSATLLVTNHIVKDIQDALEIDGNICWCNKH